MTHLPPPWPCGVPGPQPLSSPQRPRSEHCGSLSGTASPMTRQETGTGTQRACSEDKTTWKKAKLGAAGRNLFAHQWPTRRGNKSQQKEKKGKKERKRSSTTCRILVAPIDLRIDFQNHSFCFSRFELTPLALRNYHSPVCNASRHTSNSCRRLDPQTPTDPTGAQCICLRPGTSKFQRDGFC